MNVRIPGRLTAGLVAGTIVLGSLAACGKSNNDGAGDNKTLVVYSADPANSKIYQPILDKFGQQNGVTVKLISYPSADFRKNFSSAVTGNSQIDVLFANGQDVRYLKSKGLLADITGVVDPTTLVKPATEPFTIDGKLYAASFGTLSTTAFVYNEDLFSKYNLTVPKTFDDLRADAAKLNGTGVDLISVPGGNIYLWPIWLMQTIQQASSDQPTQTTQGTLQSDTPKFSDPIYVQAITALQDLGKAGVFAKGFNGVSQDAAVAQFTQQKAAMFYGGTWDLASIIQQGPSLKLKALSFPTFVPGATSRPAGGAAIAAGVYGKVAASHKDLAQKLVTYMTSAEVDTQLVAGGTGALSLPTTNGVTSKTQSALQDQIVQDFVPKTFTFLDWYWPSDVTTVFQNGIQAVVAGQQQPDQLAKAAEDALAQAKSGGWAFS
jgi:raffinose/stachyose/melibiose transport system substrate-binding protein